MLDLYKQTETERILPTNMKQAPKHIIRAFCRAMLKALDGKEFEWFYRGAGLCNNFEHFVSTNNLSDEYSLSFNTIYPFNSKAQVDQPSDFWLETTETRYLNPRRLAWLKENAQ